MRAGKLDRTIEIQRETEAVGAAGTVTRAWAMIATVRAELVDLAAAEIAAPFGEIETTGILFRTRYLSDLTTADRIMFDGQPHNLKGIVEIGRRRGLELRVERAL